MISTFFPKVPHPIFWTHAMDAAYVVSPDGKLPWELEESSTKVEGRATGDGWMVHLGKPVNPWNSLGIYTIWPDESYFFLMFGGYICFFLTFDSFLFLVFLSWGLHVKVNQMTPNPQGSVLLLLGSVGRSSQHPKQDTSSMMWWNRTPYCIQLLHRHGGLTGLGCFFWFGTSF